MSWREGDTSAVEVTADFSLAPRAYPRYNLYNLSVEDSWGAGSGTLARCDSWGRSPCPDIQRCRDRQDTA